MTNIPSGTVTFLFTDIEGSTKLAREHPEVWEVARARHHSILREAIEANNGFVFQIIGDAFCAAFHRAGDALHAALAAQQGLQTENWEEVVIRVRMGIHTGDAEVQGDEYHGYLTLSLIQRVMSAGHGGQILLSNTTENLLRGQLPEDVTLRDLGEHKLKDVPLPVRIFQVVVPDLQKEFPVLRTLSVFPNNLPTQITSFVGREKELADVKKLLQNAHMLTLIGPGGTGKTRLSIQSASESMSSYSNGVWLVELAPILDPLLVTRTTALAIGLRDEPQRPVIDMLCDYLREKKMLIILDNCEHLVDACAQMATKILQAAPNLRILASSREALGIAGEVTYRVPSLGLPDIQHLPSVESLSQYEAVKLFIDRATSAIPSFSVTNENAPALAQICYRLDGIPLAIELAAAKVRVLSVDQIAKRLDDRFRLLTGGSRTALERHQTLRATIDWSYNLLPPAEQVLFRRLSVFVNGWTLEASESVCSDTSAYSDDILELLGHLINKSIVSKEETKQETRYRMLETMRQYASEKTADSDESDALRGKHLEYFLTLAETAAPHLIRPEQLAWLAKLDADYENLRAALEWALSRESAESSLRLCAALGRFWLVRCYWLEGSRWLQNALAKKVGHASQAELLARIRCLYQDSDLADQLDDVERERSSAEQSLMLAKEVEDKHGIAIARYYLGNTLDRSGESDAGIELMKESLAEFSQMDEPYWLAFTQRQLNNILVRQHKIRVEDRNRDLELARKAGERVNLAEVLSGESEYQYRAGRFDEARKCADEVDALLKEMGSKTSTSPMLYGSIALLNGNYQEARSYFEEMQQRFQLMGEKNVRSGAIASIGDAAREEGHLDQAQKYYEDALAIAEDVNNRTFVARRLMDLARVFHLKTDFARSRQFAGKAFAIAREMGKSQTFHALFDWMTTVYIQRPQDSVRVLGFVDIYQKEYEQVLGPLRSRYWNRAAVELQGILGDAAFKSAFAEGQKMTLDEALDLALKTVEEM